MKKLTLALILTLAVAGSAVAHNGKTNFMPTWPDPTSFVLDGEEDDWGWYDTESFGVKPEGIESSNGEHAGQGPNPKISRDGFRKRSYRTAYAVLAEVWLGVLYREVLLLSQLP